MLRKLSKESLALNKITQPVMHEAVFLSVATCLVFRLKGLPCALMLCSCCPQDECKETDGIKLQQQGWWDSELSGLLAGLVKQT